MRPQDIVDLLQGRPFQPFRIYMSDGASYDVRHPELATVVTKSTVALGIPDPVEPPPPFDRVVNLALLHITRTELIDGTQPA